MKRNFLNKIVWILFVPLILLSCKEKSTSVTSATHQHDEKTYYTCPMHPQIRSDKPGTCPICGMTLVLATQSNELTIDSSLLPVLKPVNEQVISSVPVIKPESGTRIFSIPIQGVVQYDTRSQASISSRVAGRIERMYVKYNYQPIRKGQLIMEVYSPDLVAAQRELIYLSTNDPSSPMLQRAKERLSLLGMTAQQIGNIIRTGTANYRVPVYSSVSGYIVEKSVASNTSSTGSSSTSTSSSSMNSMGEGAAPATTPASQSNTNPTPVVTREGQYVAAGETIFTVYRSGNMVAEFSFTPSITSNIQKGQKLVFHPVSNDKEATTGTIGLIEPKQSNGERFSTARVYINGQDFLPGQLLVANIPVIKKGANWLPEAAVLQVGRKAVIFKKENNAFVPKEVQTGIRMNGLVEVLDAINDWDVAKNASFLVDSESFVRVNSNN